MRQVITVSLNGRAYQLEDDAHAVLSSYLADSARALGANPDAAEILADIEQAIADKCDRGLGPHKTVVGRAEIVAIVAEMGPVDGAEPAAAAAPSPGTGPGPGPAAPSTDGAGPAPKRLYQISEGAVLSGVCNGLAAYFNLDVTVVRLLFVLLVFLTGGMALLAYLVLMFVVPYASTSEEHAAARGLPFNARALVERAKRKAAEFTHSTDWPGSKAQWKREWRRARAEMRYEWRRARAEWRAHRYAAPPPPPPGAPQPPYAAHVLTGLLMALLGLVLAAITIAWIVALASLVTTGAIFGWWLPHDVPFWAALLILVVAYNLVVWPIKAVRRAAYGSYGGYRAYHGPWVAAWDGVATLAVVVLLGWYAYQHVPAVHDFLDHLRGVFEHAVSALGGGSREPSRMIGTDLLGTVLAVARADHRIGLEGLQ